MFRKPISPALAYSLQFSLLVVLDIAVLVLAYVGALWLRFDGQIPLFLLQRDPVSIAGGLGVCLLIFGFFRLYRFAWQFASMDTLISVVAGTTLGIGAGSLVMWMTDAVVLPRSVTIMIWLCGVVAIGAARMGLRLVHTAIRRLRERQRVGSRRAVQCLIMGTGEEAVHASRILRSRSRWNYQIVGFLDHRTPPATGFYIFGTRILGGVDDLECIVRSTDVDEVIIALPQADGKAIRSIALQCRALGLTPRLIPSLDVTLQQEAVLAVLPEVSVEDLLRRDPVSIDTDAVMACLRDKVVLVTGAGGSIGSELCRQIIRNQPSKLILLGHGENSIHRIAGELLSKYPEYGDRLSQVICDIRDEVRLEHLFAQERPEMVFHAAAHKHVPLMELNPPEAVKNNVGGTQNLARLAGKYEAERFVMVSTDKAVNPTSIMGATKWVCEEVVRHTAVQYPGTRFITTRFGNVLGSRGSVVPLFKEQIAHGGPVTVTHPKITRFFMTIPEAATLVLAAMSVGESGQVIVLDMGEPVAIVDLAREMIRLAGLAEGGDIKIVFTGLRPGEKMYEELFGVHEERVPTACPGLLTACRPQYLTPERFQAFVDELLSAADHWDPDRVCGILARELPSLRQTLEELPLPLQPPAEAA